MYSKKVQTSPSKLLSFPFSIVVLDPLWALDDIIQNKVSLYTTVLVTFRCEFRYFSGQVVIISFIIILSSEFSISYLLGSIEICYYVPVLIDGFFCLVIVIIRVTIPYGSDPFSDNTFVVILFIIIIILIILLLDCSPCPKGVCILGRWCSSPL